VQANKGSDDVTMLNAIFYCAVSIPLMENEQGRWKMLLQAPPNDELFMTIYT